MSTAPRHGVALRVIPGKGVPRIMVKLTDGTDFVDACDVTKAAARDRFISTLVARCPGLESQRCEIDAELMRSATDSLDRKESGNIEPPSRGSAIGFESPDPWPDQVDGAVLLDELAAILCRFLALPAHAAEAVALWIVHTYALDAAPATPRLAVMSPEKRCGKSTLLVLLRNLVHRPLMAANVSTAAVFRVIDLHRPTLLIDEADTFLADNEELRGVLNSGHEPSGHVLRVVGDDHEPRVFATFAPVAIALIGRPPATIEDRSIPILMRRRTRDEKIDKLRARAVQPVLAPMRRRIMRWVLDHAAELREAQPENPEALHDRAADGWHVLLAIADAAGGRWRAVARAAAIALHAGQDDATSSLRELLLTDVRDLFAQRKNDSLSSAEIVAELAAMEERPWPDFRNGKAITPRHLADLLAPLGIKSRNMRVGRRVPKGYWLGDFLDAFQRYLGAPSGPGAATALHPAPDNDLCAMERRYAGETVAEGNRPNPGGHNRRSAVAAPAGRPLPAGCAPEAPAYVADNGAVSPS